jgi:hypothetical protein
MADYSRYPIGHKWVQGALHTYADVATNLATSTGTSHSGFGQYRELIVSFALASVTGGTTAPTAHAFIDTSYDGGSSFVNIARTPILATSGTVLLMSFSAQPAPIATSVNVAADAAAGVVRLLPFGDVMRVRTSTTGTLAGATGTIGFMARE